MTKGELLNRIKVDRRQLDRYLFFFQRDADGEFIPSEGFKLSRKDLQESGAYEDWSIKDILAHLFGWQTYFLDSHHLIQSKKEMLYVAPMTSISDEAAITRSIYLKNKAVQCQR